MSREDILTVVVRLFALWLVMFSLQQALQVFGLSAANSEWADERAWIVGVALLPGVAAVLLWYFPLTVVTRLLPRLRSDPAPLSAPADALLDMGIILIGLWWLLSGLAWLSADVVRLFLLPEGAVGSQLPDLVSSLLTVVVSLALLLRGPGIVGAIRRFREAGYAPPPRGERREADPDQ